MPQFVLSLKDIDADAREYAFPVTGAWLRSTLDGTDLRSDPEAPDGQLAIVAQRTGDDILVTGTIKGTIIADCVRCLEDARVDVTARVASLFMARGEGHRPEPDEQDASPEELVRAFYTGDEIVLDETVREQMILEVPMQPLCSDGCPGIEIPENVRPPADFGEEEQDPRLAPLKDLAAKMQQEKE